MPTWSFYSMWLQAPWGLFPARQLGEAPVAHSEWQLQISTRQPAKKLGSKDKHPELQNTWITHHRFMPFPFSALGQLSSTPFVQEEFFVVTEHSEHEVKQAKVPWPSSYWNKLNIEMHAVFCSRKSIGKGRHQIYQSLFPMNRNISEITMFLFFYYYYYFSLLSCLYFNPWFFNLLFHLSSPSHLWD